MKAIRSTADLLSNARQQEQSGRLEEAAAGYQRVVSQDPGNKEAVRRLLMMYRKLKDFRKELAVIKAVLAAVADRDRSAQEKWMAAHPEAARLGRSMLRSLGGQQVTAYGTDPMVLQLLRRKEVVERKIGGRKPTSRKPAPQRSSSRKPPPQRSSSRKAAGQTVKTDHKRAQQAAKAAEKKRQAEERARKQRERKEAAAAKRQAAIEAQKQAAAARKQAADAAAARKQAAEAAATASPSLFVISLRYLVDLEKIDAMMKKHVAFLDKHFKKGDFLISGRQVPRTGGVIIARGKDRTRVERIMKQDPFIKGKLATVDIVEFKANKWGDL